ncbi:MAG: methyltransferase, FkbM family, partial [Ramlibacter sp.]|nr:methyltransferase, FkbM family [Ramlibacter sp.]
VASPMAGAALKLRALYDRIAAPDELAGAVASDVMAELIVSRLCEPRKIFLDIGAHIGSITARVAKHCRDSRIQAFEPVPEKAARLKRSFPSVTVHCCALAESEGQATFHVSLDNSALSSLAKRSTRVRELQVPLRTLDSMISSVDVDVMKIDVEGAELGVLRGAAALLATSRPVVMFESGPEDCLGYTKPDIWHFFQARQYAVFIPNRLAHTAPPLTLDGFLDSHLHPRRTTNYFAVPLDRIQEVRAKTRQILKL